MKFYESGKLSQVMPSGHMAHALPRENFKATAAPGVKAMLPPAAHQAALQGAIVQALRSVNGKANGLSPAGNPNQQVRGASKIISSPGQLPRTSSPSTTPQRSRF
jgi:hypothetical protein